MLVVCRRGNDSQVGVGWLHVQAIVLRLVQRVGCCTSSHAAPTTRTASCSVLEVVQYAVR